MPTLAHKIHIKPNTEQEEALWRACGCARHAYNWALSEYNRERAETGKAPRIADLKKRWNAIKGEQFPWVYDSPKDANQQPFSNLQKAFSRFFKDVEAGKIPIQSHSHKMKLIGQGVKTSQMAFPPAFKRKKDKASFYVSNDKFSLDGKQVRLPVIGFISMSEELRFPGKIISGTVSRDGNGWSLSVSVDVPEEIYFCERQASDSVGIDLGVKDAVVLSTGEKLTGPKGLRKSSRRLRIRQRRVSRKQKAQLAQMGLHKKAVPKGTRIPKSHNQEKGERSVRSISTRVVNVRRDFQHKLTTRICRENQAVTIEDLNVSGMLKNHRLAKHIADVGFYEIRRQLEYKAQRYGVTLTVADRFFPSSKTCSSCGYKNAILALSDRTWICPECGVVHDRDVNAALNLKNYPEATGKVTTAKHECPLGRSGQEPNQLEPCIVARI